MKGLIPKGIPFGMVPQEVMEDKDLTPNALRLYASLSMFAGRDGKAYPKVGTLASRLSMSRRTIQRGFNQLEDAGWIERKFNKHRITNYTVNRDPAKRAGISFRNRMRKKRRTWANKSGTNAATKSSDTTLTTLRGDADVAQTGATSVSPIKDSKKYHLKEGPTDLPRSPIQTSDISARPQLHPSREGAGDQTESHPSQCGANTPDQDRAIGWEDLGIEAGRVFPSLGLQAVNEWLGEFLYRLQGEDISFQQDERFLYRLVHGALEKISDNAFENMNLDDGAKLAKLEELIRAEIGLYGEGGDKSLEVSKNRPVG